MNDGLSKGRRITGTVLLTLGGLMLVGSAIAKFARVPMLVTQMSAFGIDGNRLLFVAILEIVSALLFLIPLTRSIGLLLVSSFLGGAIATHLQHGDPIVQPSFVLVLLWLGTWLRHPEILWSFEQALLGSGQLGHRKTVDQRS